MSDRTARTRLLRRLARDSYQDAAYFAENGNTELARRLEDRADTYTRAADRVARSGRESDR
jgi:hypothetical protein